MNPYKVVTAIRADLLPTLRMAIDHLDKCPSTSALLLDRSLHEVGCLRARIHNALHAHYTGVSTTAIRDVESRLGKELPNWSMDQKLRFLSGFIADNADYDLCIQEALNHEAWLQEQIRIGEGPVGSVDCLSESHPVTMPETFDYDAESRRFTALFVALRDGEGSNLFVDDLAGGIQHALRGFTGFVFPVPATPEQSGHNDMVRRIIRTRDFLATRGSRRMKDIAGQLKKLRLGFNYDGSNPD